MICDQWDVVTVPFPFSESAGAKRRPAVVISQHVFNKAGHAVLAMVTTRAHRHWPGDTPLTDHEHAGLLHPCMVRLKLFTLDTRLMVRKIGTLAPDDTEAVQSNLRTFLPWG